MTSSRVPTSAALFLGLLLAAPLAFADKNSDLYKKGTDAVAAGDSLAARDAFCALPADYQDAAAQCTTYKAAADRTLNRYKINFGEGMSAMQSGDYTTAEAKFRNVKAGEYAEQAKAKISEIAKLKQAKADADAQAQQNQVTENAAKAKLDAGTNAWNSGDFNTAKSNLGAVAGSHKAEADALLQKIRNYEGKMAEAQSYALNKQYPQAATAYGEAVRMNPSGPGDPLGQVGKMNQLAAAVPANNPTPTNTTATVKPPAPKPQIDAAAYIAEGNKALAKKQYARARKYFNDVISQDKNNQEAKDALAQISSLDTAQANASDDDPTLKDIIAAFYAGSRDAEDRFKTYVYANQGKKLGLARFYAGASMLTRYYLTGATDQDLKRQAQDMFKAAKAVNGFKAPDKFVSPKIMKAFQEAS